MKGAAIASFDAAAEVGDYDEHLDDQLDDWSEDEPLCECGRESLSECEQCGQPLCPMCSEVGANFCSRCPTEEYAPPGEGESPIPEFSAEMCGGNYCLWWGEEGKYVWGFPVREAEMVDRLVVELNKKRAALL